MIKILFFFLISTAFASEKLVLRIHDLHVQFQKVDGIFVNARCADKKCEAFKKAKAFESKEVSPDLLSGGKNPSSVKCKTILNGKVVIARDPQGHEQSLCWFSDDSYLIN